MNPGIPDVTDTTTAHNNNNVSTLAPRKRSKTESSVTTEAYRRSSSEWIDIDGSSPSRRKTTKTQPASSRRSVSGRKAVPSSRRSVRDRSPDGEAGRYHPSLDQISETVSTRSSARASERPSGSRDRSEKPSGSRSRAKTETSIHRPSHSKRRSSGVSQRTEAALRFNPSLLSVLSTLTGVSEQTTSSSNTVTQRSYNQARGIQTAETAEESQQETETETETEPSSELPAETINVFDFMESPDEHDGHQDAHQLSPSSSTTASSHYEASDAESNELASSPSSQSTFPSPANTREGSLSAASVSELRRKYDPHYAALHDRMYASSPDFSTERSDRKQPSVSDVTETEEGNRAQRSEYSGSERQRSSSRTSRSSRHSAGSSREAPPQLHYPPSVSGSRSTHESVHSSRSASSSSAGSGHSRHSHAQLVHLQHYRGSPPPAGAYQLQAQQAREVEADGPPPVPELPPVDDRKTIVGYEKLAMELARADSGITPLYRKFDYLNHRLLLHLQDELSEMEEQLRHLDEFIARWDPAAQNGGHTPVTRRGEAYPSPENYGFETFQRRTQLLGRIFTKTEQYNRALASFAAMNNADARPAGAAHVAAYRAWMQEHTPIHEIETKFLLRERDLIMPAAAPESRPSIPTPTSNAAASTTVPVAWLSALLLAFFPLLLFASIPTLATRLAVSAVVILATGTLATATGLRAQLPAHDWVVCGVTYVAFVLAMAGFVPAHQSPVATSTTSTTTTTNNY